MTGRGLVGSFSVKKVLEREGDAFEVGTAGRTRREEGNWEKGYGDIYLSGQRRNVVQSSGYSALHRTWHKQYGRVHQVSVSQSVSSLYLAAPYGGRCAETLLSLI